MSKFKKISLFLVIMLAVAAVYPFFNFKSDKNVSVASDEIRVTKGAEVKHPALGSGFITWIEYREGNYNLYWRDLITQKESKVTTQPISSDAVGPVAFQNYIFLVDHTVDGWNIWQFDVEHNTSKILIKENKVVQSLFAYENYLVYEAKSGESTDIFLLNRNAIKADDLVRNISNDSTYQKAPVMFGNLVAWTEFLPSSNNSGIYDFSFGRVVTYDVVSGVKTIIKDKVADLSNVQMNNWALTWSELEGSTKVVKVYGYTTGTSFNVSSGDYQMN
ncbi:MAG: hypothetical protein NTU97_03750 [Candidatus Magasanikbacteria bacterium]|nr:hypothetical protein [Candidatus Magasanikbacteria bacterium]